ncbi:MAG: thioredoxin family protein [Candidatus Acidiferrum sp.]
MRLQEMEPKFEENQINNPLIVSEAEWLVARKDLLVREKEFTRLRDEISKHRRALPWVRIEKKYVFEGPDGNETLAELFAGRSQLIVYHFMLGPGWEEGCKSCSFLADHFDGANRHLPYRDVTFVVVSRAPLSEIKPYQKRMSWHFKWVSAHGSDFNFDYHVSFTPDAEKANKTYYNYQMGEFMMDELPGLSVFYKDESGNIFHTYSTYARGLDSLIGTYNLLDLVPKGRDENPESTMDWVRRHDEYAA